MSGSRRRPFDFYAGRAKLCLGHETKIMGVLNVTPDSFSDGGCFLDPGRAEAQALRMEEEGAHLLDIGGESSKPGSKPVSFREEIRRIRPVLKRLSKKIKIPLSVDTYKYEVAEMALDEGASLINDIYALRENPRLARLVARHRAGLILMHMRGNPEIMQKDTRYRDLLRDIGRYLKKATCVALDAGVSKQRIVIDPGFGFGKSMDQNLEILSRLDYFASMNFPVLVGLSRKSFIGQVIGASIAHRLHGSLSAAVIAVQKGAHILRVHDVLPHKQAVSLVDKITQPIDLKRVK